MVKILIVLAIGCGSSARSAPPPPPSNHVAPSITPDAPLEPEAWTRPTRSKDGGAIELHGDQDRARAMALKDMTAHCGEHRAMIIQEGEEAAEPRIETTGRIVTVWRIHYQCH